MPVNDLADQRARPDHVVLATPGRKQAVGPAEPDHAIVVDENARIGCACDRLRPAPRKLPCSGTAPGFLSRWFVQTHPDRPGIS
jgi:hypothetical protein